MPYQTTIAKVSPPRIHASTLFLLAVVLIPLASVQAESRPNVLFLISDDLNTSLGCYGDPLVKTPNIDRLAARGVRFEQSYCQYPLCGPSRNSMLTGLYPNSTGIHANQQLFRQTIPSHHSLSQAFRLEGYFAARVGKLYHYNVPKSVGTNGHDDPGSWELELNPAGCDRLIEEPDIFSLRKNSFGGTLSWYASPRPDAEHTDGMLADDAKWVLERCAKRKDRPFFLAVGFYRPHTPYVAPKPYFDGYDLAQMPITQNVDTDVKDLPQAALGSHKKDHELLTDSLRREAIQAYYASTSFMDAQVGKVLDSLEELGLADNTIVVFTSDHGYHLGEHGLWQKMSLFEQSARVPMIIAAPGIEGGKVSKSPVGLVDLYPTLTELCDVKAPDNLQGQSLVGLMENPLGEGRGWALSQVQRNQNKRRFFGYSLRTPDWRYTRWDDGKDGAELYDHRNDPLEITNLAHLPAHSDQRQILDALMDKAIATTFPANGETPKIQDRIWAPNLTNP
ncbi:Choline-sulfatase [Roseimaritima multifibrata]|uniref:Choline-sulfatase n=1 Tax=Roseimaritima multifibrata TaxID=1930274 RepID=A0A517MES6_9BACT|nr:sulfatase [Roseimaritima multifibrata]QDS93390.1 Choline-sulfatase [Roseimaritima multifibrata]